MLEVTPESDPELFWGTAGGMGLTGIVTEATIRCIPIETSLISVDTERAADLDDVMARDGRGRRRSTGTPWRGSTASPPARSSAARCSPAATTRRSTRCPARSARRALDFAADGAARRAAVGAQRAAQPVQRRARSTRCGSARRPATRSGHLESIASFFHPLDGVRGWNRLYGSRGFVQYQYVVPDDATDTVRATLEALSEPQCASFLAVLKRFGPGNPGPLSFPAPGLDPRARHPGGGAASLADLLDRLDRLVVDVGGRVYLAKDSRLDAALVARDVPRARRVPGPARPRRPRPACSSPTSPAGSGSSEFFGHPTKGLACATHSATSSRCSSSAAAPTSRSRPCAGSSDRRARTVVLAAHHPDALDAARDELLRRRRHHRGSRRLRRRRHRHHTARSIDDCFDRFGDFDVVLLAFGVLGDQAEAEHDAAAALEIARVNYLGTVSVAVPVRQRLQAAGPRDDRGAVVGRGRARPPLELRVRLVEGRDGRVPPGPRRQPRRDRRAT